MYKMTFSYPPLPSPSVSDVTVLPPSLTGGIVAKDLTPHDSPPPHLRLSLYAPANERPHCHTFLSSIQILCVLKQQRLVVFTYI